MQQQLEYIQLGPDHNPLVELAIRLGYTVYLCRIAECLQGSLPQYRIDNGLGRYSDSDDLVDALSFLIKRDMLSITSPAT